MKIEIDTTPLKVKKEIRHIANLKAGDDEIKKIIYNFDDSGKITKRTIGPREIDDIIAIVEIKKYTNRGYNDERLFIHLSDYEKFKRKMKLSKIVGEKVILTSSLMLPEKETANLKLEIGKYYFLGADLIEIIGETRKYFLYQEVKFELKNKEYQEKQEKIYHKEFEKLRNNYIYDFNNFDISCSFNEYQEKQEKLDDIYTRKMTVDDVIPTNNFVRDSSMKLRLTNKGDWTKSLKNYDILSLESYVCIYK